MIGQAIHPHHSVPAGRVVRHPGWRRITRNCLYPQGVSQGSGEAGVIGRVLGGRYRLVNHIGAGRFTNAYLAYDLSQSRRVAVKLLSEDIVSAGGSRDGTFANIFAEAAEQASLITHPHLVAVRDWGDSDFGLYVVTDYLEGGSLLGMLDSGHLLSPSQALMVGLEVTRGLEHIHRQGHIHRDIRPSNILFDGRGRARLADLGTSWVLTSSESGGALMSRSVFSAIDAVRYASPEQAQGLTPDHKSDVYSLVLVLTEALSGRVPFESEDPEYTQMAKMSRKLDFAGQYARLGRVLEQAGQPERDDRPSAEDLAIGLLSAAESLPRPTPLPLARAEPEITLPDKGTDAGIPEGRKEAGPPAGVNRGVLRRLVLALMAIVLLGAAGFGAFALWENQVGNEVQQVPDLTEADEADLNRIVSEFGWELDRLDRRQDGTVAGQVISQDPQPGIGLEQGEMVTVWVSLGPELVAIPRNLVGIAVEDAEVLLGEAGLSVGEVTGRHDEAVVEGVVIEVDELFPEVDPGGSVGLVVSLGPVPRVVPEIAAGASLVVARERLEELRLGVLEWREADNLVEADHVVRVDPPPGTEVAADSVITVVISDGPEQVRVPFLATLGVGEASIALEEVGLCLGIIEGPTGSEILTSNPPADAVVDHGTCVGLITRPEGETDLEPEDG